MTSAHIFLSCARERAGRVVPASFRRPFLQDALLVLPLPVQARCEIAAELVRRSVAAVVGHAIRIAVRNGACAALGGAVFKEIKLVRRSPLHVPEHEAWSFRDVGKEHRGLGDA